LPLAGLASAALGFIIGLPSIRTKDIYLGIATLGFGLLFEQSVTNMKGLTGGASGMAVKKSILAIGPIKFESDIGFYYFVLVITVILLIAGNNLIQGKIGRSFRAIKDSEVAAQAMGINVTKYKLIAFTISAFFTGVAGAMYAPYISYLSAPMFSIFLAISLLSMVVIGGMGSILGSILGALFVVITPEIFRIFGLGEVQTFAFSLAMIVVLIAFPTGMAGGVHRLLKKYNLKAKEQRT
jgi:branched-chain amino acid transport system permease protein